MGTVILDISKTVATEIENEIHELCFHLCCHCFGSAFFCSNRWGVPIILSKYKSLVFCDEFLAQGLHLKSFKVIVILMW